MHTNPSKNNSSAMIPGLQFQTANGPQIEPLTSRALVGNTQVSPSRVSALMGAYSQATGTFRRFDARQM